MACVSALVEACDHAAVRSCEAAASQTALYAACEHGYVELAAFLLRCGSPLSAMSSTNGDGVLHLGARLGNAVLLDTLVSEADATDLLTAKAQKNKAGQTPLDVAKAAGLSSDVLHEVQQLLS